MKMLQISLFAFCIMATGMAGIWLYSNGDGGCIVRPGETIITPADADGAYFIQGRDGAEFLVNADGGRFQLGSDMTDNYTPPPRAMQWIYEILLVLFGMLAGGPPLLLLLAARRRSTQRAVQIGTWRREPGGEWEVIG